MKRFIILLSVLSVVSCGWNGGGGRYQPVHRPWNGGSYAPWNSGLSRNPWNNVPYNPLNSGPYRPVNQYPWNNGPYGPVNIRPLGVAKGSAGGNVVTGETYGPGGAVKVTNVQATAQGYASDGGSSNNAAYANHAQQNGLLGQSSTSNSGAFSNQRGGGGYGW